MLPLLDLIKERRITVGIIGLGHVGFPLALSFVEGGATVIGFDCDSHKIEQLNHQQSYIQHIDNKRLKHAFSTSRLSATTDYHRIQNCQAVLICVPTPLGPHREPDLRYIMDTCKAIAPFLNPYTLVALESTTWPGTTEEVIKPLLEKESARIVGKDLYLAYSPEREDPGNLSYTTHTIPKLCAGFDEESLTIATALYKIAIQKVIPIKNLKVAESAKLFENIFRSVNIALVNELKMIFDKMGIDVWEVIEAAATKPFGFMPFWPGPGLGGHCIPIDPFYLSWKAKEYGLSARFIELAGEINHYMPHFVIEKVQDVLNKQGKPLKNAKILILGLSYKANVDDMRESPSLELMAELEKKGATAHYYDPLIPEIGPTRAYDQLKGRFSQEPSSDYDCFLLATPHALFSPEVLLSYNVPIVDTRHFFPKHPLVTPS